MPLQKQQKPVYVEICCNLAALTHASFTDPPIPIALAQRHTNKGELKALLHSRRVMASARGSCSFSHQHPNPCRSCSRLMGVALQQTSTYNSGDCCCSAANALAVVAASLDAAVEAAAAVLASSSKPVLLGGPRLRAHRRREAFKKLAEAFQARNAMSDHAAPSVSTVIAGRQVDLAWLA